MSAQDQAVAAGVRMAVGIAASHGERELVTIASDTCAEECGDPWTLAVAHRVAFNELARIIESNRKALDRAYGDGAFDAELRKAASRWQQKAEAGE